MDPVTAKIAKALHPEHDIKNEGFEDTRIKASAFSLAIGNVPFGDIKLNDPEHNKDRQHSIHNHFILKSLALTAPGGLACLLTSRFTMDSQDPSARRAMADLADLVAAVRLPEGAFRASASTEVVTDCLIFRRRAIDEAPRSAEWVDSLRNQVGEGESWYSRYYVEHPGHVLGTHALARGMHHDAELTVLPDRSVPLAESLAAAFVKIADQARDDGLVFSASVTVAPPEASVPHGVKRGAFTVVDGRLCVHDYDGTLTPDHGVREPDVDRVMRLVGLRDTAREILTVQRGQWDGEGAAPWAGAQRRLGGQYDSFVEKYGPINKVQVSRLPPSEEGEERVQRRYPNMRAFRPDPDSVFTSAIEIYDENSMTARRAPIFDTRVLSPRKVVRESSSVADALLVCLDERGKIDLSRIGELVGKPSDEAAAELLAAKLIYRIPRPKGETEIRYETADEYLSGDVRKKLARAEAAARKNPDAWQANVDALRAVQPADIPPNAIDVALGASWIPAADVRDFIREALDLHDAEVGHNTADGSWSVRGGKWGRSSVRSTVEYGTKRMDALALIAAGLNQRLPEVFDIDEDDKRVKNITETLNAQEKLQKLNDRFGQWVWKDEDRAVRLCKRYNAIFNATRLREYDGSHLTLPGKSSAVDLNRHQLDAVWRGMQGNTLLAHCVGSGKTFVGIAIAMESKRVGLCSLPVLSVPGHMLEQASREWQMLYPDSNLLAATVEDLSQAGRLRLQAKLACGCYDGVILTHNGLGHIGVSPETERKFVEAECAELRTTLENAKKDSDSGLTVKSIEKSIKRLEEKLEAAMNSESKDKMVCLEELGIDRIIIDESHLFKNLAFATKQQSVNANGSQRATDLFMKIRYLESVHPGNCVTFMSATPVANSISEVFTNQRYLALDALKARGIAHYDSWSACYARSVTAVELDVTGGFRLKTRIAKYANVPELVTQFREFADVKTRDMLPNITVPALKGGKPQVVTVAASQELREFIAGLAERAEAVRSRSVLPDVDNMLRICTDGRKASLALELIGKTTDADTKITAATREIMRVHEHSKGFEYLGNDGKPSPIRGACLIVFCDTSTPAKADGSWNAYDALKSSVVKAGMPANKIRFIHEANTDEQKARLFRQCREGEVSVIVGSTAKLGCGTNIQNRLIAEIDLDAPYRPDEVEQRSGRISRQGNQNLQYGREIEIIRVVTEQSFDSYMWQMLERKQGFISQVMKGNLESRNVEEVSDMTLSFAEVKALATGDSRLMELAVVSAEVAKLTRLKSSYDGEIWRLRGIRHSATKEIERLTEDIHNLDRSLRQCRDTTGDLFRMRVGGGDFLERKPAGEALVAAARREATKTLGLDGKVSSTVALATIGGFAVRCETGGRVGTGRAEIILDAPYRQSVSTVDMAKEPPDPVGIIRSLEHRLRGFDATKAQAITRVGELQTQIRQAERQLDLPWEHQTKLDAALARQQEIEACMRPTTETSLEPAATISVLERHQEATACPAVEQTSQPTQVCQPDSRPRRAACLSL